MNTHSLCPVCHRHIEATIFERDGVVRMDKHCPEHGQTEAVVVLDVTDRCNLTCAHCYHIPYNHAENKSIRAIMNDVGMTPDGFSQ